MSMPAKTRPSLRRSSVSSAPEGGSLGRSASVTTLEPIGSETDHVTPPAAVPTTSSVEPPPTSTTPSRPSGGSASMPTAPANARRASSSPERISRVAPQASWTAATRASALTAWRTAAVATTRSDAAPSSSAARTWRATIVVTSATFSGVSSHAPPPIAPSRANARSENSSRKPGPSSIATSSRVVFDPTSMQAQRTTGAVADLDMIGPMDSAAPAILVRDLVKSYGPIEAVRGIDFEVERGEVFGLLGPNGAGKTTTVEVLEGYRARTSGIVSVLGYDPGGRPRAMRERVGIVLQASGTYRHATVRELVTHWAGFYPAPRDVDEVIDLAGLRESENVRARRLSGGQARRLDFALALVGDPELIFLDEPTTGFDPAARRAAWETIRALADLGKTVLITTHYLDEAQALCDRVAIIKGGRILAIGAPSELGVDAATRYRVGWRDDDGSMVSRETDDPTALLHQLTSAALARGVGVKDLSVTRPSLEDVYLELTAEPTVPVEESTR